MTPATILPETTPPTRSVLLVETLQLVRRLRDDLRDCREALRVSVELLAERDKQLDSARRQNTQLRAELRAAASGRTIAEERQAIEAEVTRTGQVPDRVTGTDRQRAA